MIPHLSQPGEAVTLPPDTKTYWCNEHGQTVGAWYCAGCGSAAALFGNATAAEIGEQELERR